MRLDWVGDKLVLDDDEGNRTEHSLVPDANALIRRRVETFAVPKAVYSILLSARQAFASGRASYANAFENLSALIPEVATAESVVAGEAMEIVKVFLPPIPESVSPAQAIEIATHAVVHITRRKE